MADVAAPNPQQQVPLDTIPISPSDGSVGNTNTTSSASGGADSDIKTVFHDPENFNVKHPLLNTWTLWFTKPPSGKVSMITCGTAKVYATLLAECLHCYCLPPAWV